MPQQCAQQNIETKAQQQSCPPCQKSKLKHATPLPPSKKTPLNSTQPKTSFENYKTSILSH